MARMNPQVSRALGDADFKTGPTGPLVSSCPEVTSAKLNAQRDEFVLLACGLSNLLIKLARVYLSASPQAANFLLCSQYSLVVFALDALVLTTCAI